MNKYGAPGLAELTACGALELENAPNHLMTFILNSVFHVTLPDPLGRLAFMFMRRSEHAVREYQAGRKLLVAYVNSLPNGNKQFLGALEATTHFEQCIGSICQAGALMFRFHKQAFAEKTAEKEDGVEKRLKKIWNRSKHFDEDLVDKQIWNLEITAPVWLTNSSICSTDADVTFEELHGAIKNMIESNCYISEVFPRQAIEARNAGSSGTDQPQSSHP